MSPNESSPADGPAPQDPAPLRPEYVDPTDAHDVSRYGSGKFRLNVDAYAYSLSLDGCSPMVGGIDEFGRYYVRVDGPFLPEEAKERDELTAKDIAFLGTVAGAILSEDDQGFVSAVWFATDAQLEYAWNEAEEWEARLIAEREDEEDEGEDEEDEGEDEIQARFGEPEDNGPFAEYGRSVCIMLSSDTLSGKEIKERLQSVAGSMIEAPIEGGAYVLIDADRIGEARQELEDDGSVRIV